MPTSTHRNIPIFPLNIFILPGGITRLKIFEQRYIRLVTEAIQKNGFVICPPLINNQVTWGCHVSIIDFEQQKNGLLHITVKANNLVSFSNIYYESDGLAKADMQNTTKETIFTYDNPQQVQQLTDLLIDTFNTHKILSELYPLPRFDNIQWVCSRWLELLPISLNEKIQLLKSTSPAKRSTILSNILLT